MKKIPVVIAEDSPFLTTETRQTRWAIPYNFECLNARIDTLLTRNLDCVKGKKILDIGSHIGTFAYSALKLGAEFVQGIDAENKTIARGEKLFQQAKIPATRYDFKADDVFRYLENLAAGSFDTVLCLGVLYYTVEPYRLLKLMRKVARETILLDTFTAAYAAVQGKDAAQVYQSLDEESLKLPMMLTAMTQPEKKDYRLPHSFPHRDADVSLITLPTRALLEIWFQSLGMRFAKIDWRETQTRLCTYHDLVTSAQKKSSHWADVYSSGIRVSYLLRK